MAAKQTKVFPAGLAQGGSFCNREIEKERFKQNIENITHTLIISPRRYGKTSLVLETLRLTQIPFAYIQFFNVFQDTVIVKRFIQGLSVLLASLATPSQRALKKLGSLLKHGKLVLKTHDVAAEFSLEPLAIDPIEAIQGLLSDVEFILKKYKKKAVIFLDEFQDIINSDLSNELQSVLRDFIQQTSQITFIISGSHRHMLLKLFDDRNKPFYKLFERIILTRIDQKHYQKFFQKLASSHWNKMLAKEVVALIFQLTECHAYYVNRFCQKLWSFKSPPNLAQAHETWQQLVEEEFSTVALELASLTKNQRIVLHTIAKYETLKEPTGMTFLNQVKLSHGSVKLALQALEKDDFVERTDNGYQIIDPILKYVLLI